MVESFSFQCPRVAEDRVPLSSDHDPASGLQFDTDVLPSIPGSYRPPPAPLQYEMALEHPQIPAAPWETVDNSNGTELRTNSDFVNDAMESDKKAHCNPALNIAEEPEVELSKSLKSKLLVEEEEDVCPTCLEGNAL